MSGMRGHSGHSWKDDTNSGSSGKKRQNPLEHIFKIDASYWLPLKSAQNNNGDTREAAC